MNLQGSPARAAGLRGCNRHIHLALYHPTSPLKGKDQANHGLLHAQRHVPRASLPVRGSMPPVSQVHPAQGLALLDQECEHTTEVDSCPEPACVHVGEGAVPGSSQDDSFMGFNPDFGSYPASGQLRPDWLLAPGANVPAGPGQADRAGFQMWQQRLQVQGRELVLAGPANLNSVTFWYWRRGLKGMDPFWARPWPSGLALADLILRQPDLVKGKRILELGAGVGAAGIAAALAGAREVVVTDREPLALQCAALSARACGLTARVNLSTQASCSDSVTADASSSGLPVGAAVDSAQQQQQQQQEQPCQVICELLDWSQPVPSHLGRFDLVLATDVLYEHLDVPMLAGVVAHLIGCTEPGSPHSERVTAAAHQPQETRGCGLLLAEYPHRYPANQRNFQLLMQAPPLNLHLTDVRKELVQLPRFENEMLDFQVDLANPVIRTDFLLFMQNSNQQREGVEGGSTLSNSTSKV